MRGLAYAIGASAIYEISKSTLAKWRLKGCGPPYVKRGSWLRYDTDKFDEWVAAHERTSTSQETPPPSALIGHKEGRPLELAKPQPRQAKPAAPKLKPPRPAAATRDAPHP